MEGAPVTVGGFHPLLLTQPQCPLTAPSQIPAEPPDGLLGLQQRRILPFTEALHLPRVHIPRRERKAQTGEGGGFCPDLSLRNVKEGMVPKPQG